MFTLHGERHSSLFCWKVAWNGCVSCQCKQDKSLPTSFVLQWFDTLLMYMKKYKTFSFFNVNFVTQYSLLKHHSWDRTLFLCVASFETFVVGSKWFPLWHLNSFAHAGCFRGDCKWNYWIQIALLVITLSKESLLDIFHGLQKDNVRFSSCSCYGKDLYCY